MKKRDFYTLPFGKVYAKDRIYTYEIVKHKTDDGSWFCWITLKGEVNGMRISAHPSEDFVYEENDRWRYGKHKYKTLTYNMGVGMLFACTDAHMYYLNELELVPNGSFKKYVQNELPLIESEVTPC